MHLICVCLVSVKFDIFVVAIYLTIVFNHIFFFIFIDLDTYIFLNDLELLLTNNTIFFTKSNDTNYYLTYKNSYYTK